MSLLFVIVFFLLLVLCSSNFACCVLYFMFSARSTSLSRVLSQWFHASSLFLFVLFLPDWMVCNTAHVSTNAHTHTCTAIEPRTIQHVPQSNYYTHTNIALTTNSIQPQPHSQSAHTHSHSTHPAEEWVKADGVFDDNNDDNDQRWRWWKFIHTNRTATLLLFPRRLF